MPVLVGLLLESINDPMSCPNLRVDINNHLVAPKHLCYSILFIYPPISSPHHLFDNPSVVVPSGEIGTT